MADNPAEEQSNDDSVNARSENTAHDIDPPKDVPPIESNQESENMEVHYHPKLEHKRKHWKEYLLEGFMIFVAVTLGFIAENIREGITNRQHARELVSQLVHDLKNDTSQLNGIYEKESDILQANSALSDLLNKPLTEVNTDRLQRLIAASHNIWMFYPSTGAIAAIKNEIHLRQFSNSNMIGLIADYEKHIDLIRTVQGITLQYQRTYIDPFLLRHFTPANLNALFNNMPAVSKDTRNLSEEDLIQMGSDMALISLNTKELLGDNRRLFADASKLLEYAEKQFNLPMNEGK
ncbi:MAG: hypothetical protein C5B59_19605 [Bacteroidetes bacterium]|nr:MAG: hypothetical protein C5B59_19605 [Bacteroidota bacterium]